MPSLSEDNRELSVHITVLQRKSRNIFVVVVMDFWWVIQSPAKSSFSIHGNFKEDLLHHFQTLQIIHVKTLQFKIFLLEQCWNLVYFLKQQLSTSRKFSINKNLLEGSLWNKNKNKLKQKHYYYKKCCKFIVLFLFRNSC